MLRKFLIIWALILTSAILCVLISCNSSPTVPVPPPEMAIVSVSAPDLDGNVSVTGEQSAANVDDVIIVFNESNGNGVMGEVNPDGSFEINVAAEANDILIVQIKRDNKLSSEEELIVPIS